MTSPDGTLNAENLNLTENRLCAFRPGVEMVTERTESGGEFPNTETRPEPNRSGMKMMKTIRAESDESLPSFRTLHQS